MTLAKRARVLLTTTARIRTWPTPDGRYALEEIESLLGFPRRYIVAERLPNGNELPISHHRKRSAAIKRLQALTDRQSRLFR
jgi:hypothetical protein